MLDESLTVLLILVDIVEIALCVIVLSEINDDDDDDIGRQLNTYSMSIISCFSSYLSTRANL